MKIGIFLKKQSENGWENYEKWTDSKTANLKFMKFQWEFDKFTCFVSFLLKLNTN